MTGRIILITGAGSGLGAELARQVAASGDYPILAGRSRDKLETVSATIPQPHQLVELDVTNDGITRVLQDLIKTNGRIDVLINNAGLGYFQPLQNLSLQQITEMMDVNYLGIVRMTRLLLPQMLAQQSGHIINIASAAGYVATAKGTGYAASKHAVIGFTHALQEELRRQPIHVSLVNPGPIRTPFFKRADPSGEYVERLKGWILEPEQVAKQVVRLIQQPKREVFIPRAIRWGYIAMLLFPRLYHRLVAPFVNRK
ncbi:SDR family NAD(P)-dependent oxidoreductase [Rubeoparvulum massiliense]|uniref:SDR family NAD(P)-dependent oxidoreductase n=1 Tax=Rubeoparvulum massiliense TaxID=1631346 RepID=UPI00065E9991|nr:SDR family oxidoreductase [Rubeoparvulum massiliense]